MTSGQPRASVGVIGLGAMGSALADALVAKVFAITPEFLQGIDPNELLLSADEPCIEDIQILRALSRLLARGEATHEEQFADE